MPTKGRNPVSVSPATTNNTRTELIEIRRQTAELLADLREVRSELRAILSAEVEAQRERYTNQVRLTESLLTQALGSGFSD